MADRAVRRSTRRIEDTAPAVPPTAIPDSSGVVRHREES
jgi:hypothetical protein